MSRRMMLAAIVPLALGVGSAVIGLILQPELSIPAYPESQTSIVVDARNLKPSDRICAVFDVKSLWTDDGSIGFPLVVGANISGHSQIRVTADSGNRDSVFNGPLSDKANSWTRVISETMTGPSDFCSRMEEQLTGTDVRRFAIEAVLLPDPNGDTLNVPADNLLVTLVKRETSQNLIVSEGTRALTTPGVSIELPEATENRGTLGDVSIIGDSAGYSQVEEQPFQVRPDVWKGDDFGEVH